MTHRLGLNRSIGPIQVTLTGTTTFGQSRPGSNDNEQVLYIPLISRSEALTSNVVYFYIPNTFWIGIMSWVFTNGPGYQGSIPGRVIPKTKKIVLDISLLNSQHYKLRIKGNV